MRRVLLTFILIAAWLSGCTKQDEKALGVSGQGKVALDDVASFAAIGKGTIGSFANTCPTSNTCVPVSGIANFKIKMMGVSIQTESDSQSGYGSLIYANPDCPTEELETEIDKKFYKYIGSSGCSDANITTFVDLKSATVNADLNAQFLPIAPGSYKYGMLGFCQGGAQSNNYSVTVAAGTLPGVSQAVTLNTAIGTCGVTTPEMDPAMVVGEGESVVVALQYDLSNTVYYRTLSSGESVASGCAEVDGGGGTRYQLCINPPTISATFTRQ